MTIAAPIIAFLAEVLVFAGPGPEAVVSAMILIAAALAVAVYQLAKAPLRVRLTVEVLMAVALLAMSVYVRQPRLYVEQADRAARLARLASAWAEEADGPTARAILRREAAWFSRRAFALRMKALRDALVGPPPAEERGPLSDRELVRELELLREMEEHEDAARQAHRPDPGGGAGPVP